MVLNIVNDEARSSFPTYPILNQEVPPIRWRYQSIWNVSFWSLKKTASLVLEIGKITLATEILSLGIKFTFPVISKEIMHTIIITPVLEETFFRGFMQKSIRLGQEAWNWYRGQKPTEAQQAFRVRATSIAFGASHLLRTGSLNSRIIQSVNAGIEGLAYGELAEIYQTVAITVLIHGLNNGLCMANESDLVSDIHAIALISLLHLSNHYVVQHGGYLPTFKHLVLQISSSSRFSKAQTRSFQT